MQLRPCRGLRDFLLETPPDCPSYLVALWLLGRCSTRYSRYGLEAMDAEQTAISRRHYARALYRVEAWQRLRDLCMAYPEEPRLAALLTMKYRRPLASRLARFAEHVDRSHQSETQPRSSMPLWFREGTWYVTPPKSAEWIRMMLRRIRRWVGGAH